MFGKAPYESLIWERCVGASAFTVFLFICFPSFFSRRDAFGPTALAQTPPRPAFVTRRFGAPPLTAYFTDALVRLRHLELTRRPREPKLRDHNKSLPVRMCIPSIAYHCARKSSGFDGKQKKPAHRASATSPYANCSFSTRRRRGKLTCLLPQTVLALLINCIPND